MRHGGSAVRRLVVGLVAAVALVGCGGGESATSGDPLAGGSASRGQEVFANNCAQCHGTDLGGTDQGPPLIHEYYVPGHHGDAAFLMAVQRGVQPHHWDFGRMPPVTGLSVDDVADVVAYVRRQQREAGLIE